MRKFKGHIKIVHPYFFLGDAKRLTNSTLGIYLYNRKKDKKEEYAKKLVGEIS